MCIDYAFRPRLSSRLTLERTNLPPETLDFRPCMILTCILATHSGILTSIHVHSSLPLLLHRVYNAPLPNALLHCLSFGVMFSPVKFSAQSHSTSELLRTL